MGAKKEEEPRAMPDGRILGGLELERAKSRGGIQMGRSILTVTGRGVEEARFLLVQCVQVKSQAWTFFKIKISYTLCKKSNC